MKRSEVYHRRACGVTPARTRPYYKKSYDLRSRSPCTERLPTAEELEAAASPELGFTPDPALLPRSRRGRQFLHGPLDWGEICQVASVSREALPVWLLIHHRRKLTGELWITLPARELTRLRVDRTAKRRALKVLEAEGLIRAQRTRGHTTLVMLVREV
jgi:hypothetical protein